MDKRIFKQILIILIFNFYGIDGKHGFKCGVCTFLFTTMKHFGDYQNVSFRDSLTTFVSYLPPEYKSILEPIDFMFGSFIAEKFEISHNPDETCQRLGLCSGFESCNLFPTSEVRNETTNFDTSTLSSVRDFQVCDMPPFQHICKQFERAFNRSPKYDKDGDDFSPVEVGRGYIWRGKDCNDSNANVYPGRKPINGDREYDSNCNGIWGVNPVTGNAYEDEFCGNTGSRGIIHFGDSVGCGAHFPMEWADVRKFEPGIFDNVTFAIENNFGWPHTSFATGFQTGTWDMVQKNGSTDSLYWRMRNRNLCNNNDYHNLAFNGAFSESIANINLKYIRSQTLDKPATVIYALFGGDVCNNEKDTIANMTSPEDFRKNVRKFYKLMDTILPPKSFILALGIIDFREMYHEMKLKLHPVGSGNDTFTNYDIYEWLSCLEILTCRGWLSSNETLRDLTAQKADELSSIMEKFSKEKTYKNFEVHYLRLSLMDVFKDYMGNMDLVMERFHGFHPNRRGQLVLAGYIAKYLMEHCPQFLGDVNPHNDDILRLFGNL